MAIKLQFPYIGYLFQIFNISYEKLTSGMFSIVNSKHYIIQKSFFNKDYLGIILMTHAFCVMDPFI